MIGNVAAVAGAVMVTEAGIDTCPSADSNTVTEPFGAWFNVTVPVAVVPWTVLAGCTTSLDTATVLAGGVGVEAEVVQPLRAVDAELTGSLTVTRQSGAAKPLASTRKAPRVSAVANADEALLRTVTVDPGCAPVPSTRS